MPCRCLRARLSIVLIAGVAGAALVAAANVLEGLSRRSEQLIEPTGSGLDLAPADRVNARNAAEMLVEGRETFRFDTFGDEVFWGDTLRLHEAIAGEPSGGVGPGFADAALASASRSTRRAPGRSD